MAETPKTGLGVILMKDDKLLIGKRINSHGHNTWSFPGGHIERFETFGECAKRETYEETGLEIELINEPQLYYTRDFFEDENKDYFTFYQKAKYISGKPKRKEKDKCLEWKWDTWENIKQYENLFIPLQNLIKQGFDPYQSDI